MELAPSRKQVTHDRILDAAARALRVTGFDGIGIADIMKQAGLTHGGFYAHFPSRDALLAEALERANQDSRLRLAESASVAVGAGATPLRALVESYLSERHLATPETGCPVATLASEIARQPQVVREAGRKCMADLLEDVSSALPAGCPPGAASMVLAQLLGTLQMARALGSRRGGLLLLAQARAFLLENFDCDARSA